MKADRFKALTGWAMATLWRLFAPADAPRCEKHGVRLRRMRSYSYYKETLCPVCNRRTVRMKAYPFSFYGSASGLVWTSVILAVGAVVIWGGVPGVQALSRRSAEKKIVRTAVIDAMPSEWASLYRTLEQIQTSHRGAAFMEFATGSRKLSTEDRSPIVRSMPALSPDGAGLFMSLFDQYDDDNVMPVLMLLASPQQPDVP